MIILDEEGRERMRVAGRFNAQLMDEVRSLVAPGVSLSAIDQFVTRYTVDHGHVPACLGYESAQGVPFPASCCTSVNDVVCHGIPDDYVLKDGDIVNIDLTTIVDGWHGDSSETFQIGEVALETARLVECALECLHLGIAAARPLGSIRAIGAAITKHAEAKGFSVVRIFQGHGIGRKFHQEPGIPHFPGHALSYNPLIPGMCFTIEPMINAGTHQCAIDMLGDGWTARTTDGGLSAQFEHTLLMGENGPEILTLTKHGPQPPCQNPVPDMDLTCGDEGSHELRRYCSEECADREGKAELASLGITTEMMKDAMDGYYECKEMIEKKDSPLGGGPPGPFG